MRVHLWGEGLGLSERAGALLTTPRPAGAETEIARLDRTGALVGRDAALVIVTGLQGRWAVQVYSSFLMSSTENGRR